MDTGLTPDYMIKLNAMYNFGSQRVQFWHLG